MDTDKWIRKVEGGGKLTEDEIQVLCENVKSMLDEESNVHEVPSPVTVCRFHDLMKLLQTEDHVPDTNYIFMGDFADHGYCSLEVFLKLLLLKARYPEKITLLHGNVESRQPTQVGENDNARKYCTDVIDSFTPSPDMDGIVVCVRGSLFPAVKKIDQMPILCPVTQSVIRKSPYLINDCYQSRYMTEFKEIKFIDSGSFGHVCMAKNYLDGKEYAIKKVVLTLMLEHIIEQEPFLFAQREVTAISQMNHPRVIRYYQAWIEPRLAKTEFTDEDLVLAKDLLKEKNCPSPCLYIQLQYCVRSFSDFLGDKDTTRDDRICVWKEIVDGLSYIHSQNYIHCDLSRSNILMDGENKPIIVDFGLARRLNKEESNIRLKSISEYPYWMPPEMEAEEDIGVAADIYSLAFICFELFRFRPIEYQEWDADVSNLKQRNIPDDWMSLMVREMLRDMLSKSPASRPSLQSCSNQIDEYFLVQEQQQLL